MSQRPSTTESDAYRQASEQTGVSLVGPTSSHRATDRTVIHDVGPRASEWLPAVHDTLLPVATRIVRELAFDYDARILEDQRPRLFAREELHRKHGVGTWATTYPEALTQYALRFAGVDPDTLSTSERRKYEELHTKLTTLGTGRDAFNTGLDILDKTIIPLLNTREDPTPDPPTLVLLLDGQAWTEVADERTAARALDTLALFGEVCDVRLVCSPRLEHHLERTHPKWYDDQLCLTDPRNGSGDSAPTPADDRTQALADAWGTIGQFTPGGGRLRLLAALSTDTEREVRDLKADSEIDLSSGAIDRYVRELADEHGLVAIDDRHRYNRVMLTDTGRAAQALLGPDCRPTHPEQARLDSGLTRTRHDRTSIVCRADTDDSPLPPSGSGGGGSRDAGSTDGRSDETSSTPTTASGGSEATAASSAPSMSSSRAAPARESSLPLSVPSAEEWLADTGTAATEGYVQWLDGPDGRLDAWGMHERLLAGRRVEGVTFVDDPIEAFDDGQVTYVSCFEDHAQIVAQWGGPLPTLVRITAALLSEKMFSKVLTPSAVGDELEELYDGALDDAVQDILRLGAQVGWCSEDEREYDGLRERFGAVRRRLLATLGDLTDDASTSEWSDCCRDAHGLLASATHLYTAADVDVTMHIRVPDTQTLQAGEQRYAAFCDFFKHTVPKNATYGVHSVYRMLYESRVDKLKHRLGYDFDDQDDTNETLDSTSTVDTADNLDSTDSNIESDNTHPTAELTASWVVSGPTATRLREDVETAIASKASDVRDQIQEGIERGVALRIPVVTGNGYAALRNVVERHAHRKGFHGTDDQQYRPIVRLCLATLGESDSPGRCSPYAAAEALLAISGARSPNASLTVSDVAYGLRQLPASRLLPSVPPTMQRVLKVLLSSDEPLGRAEIVDRAGISGRSYDRNIDELAALDLAEASGTGGHRKWNAWLIPWWSPLIDRERPRTADSDDNALAPPSRWDDILYRFALDLGLTPDYELFAGTVDPNSVFDALPVLNRWHGFLEYHYGHPEGALPLDRNSGLCSARRGSSTALEIGVRSR